MILYSDEYTRKFELEGKWIHCVQYLHENGRQREKIFRYF